MAVVTFGLRLSSVYNRLPVVSLPIGSTECLVPHGAKFARLLRFTISQTDSPSGTDSEPKSASKPRSKTGDKTGLKTCSATNSAFSRSKTRSSTGIGEDKLDSKASSTTVPSKVNFGTSLSDVPKQKSIEELQN